VFFALLAENPGIYGVFRPHFQHVQDKKRENTRVFDAFDEK
jgi:hypothetical protein